MWSGSDPLNSRFRMTAWRHMRGIPNKGVESDGFHALFLFRILARAMLQESHNREWLEKKTKLIDPLVDVMCKNMFTTEFAPRESARARRGRKEETGASTESALTKATPGTKVVVD